MPLIDLCMSGAEWRSSEMPTPRPVDFAVSGKGAVLVALMNWWAEDWGNLVGILSYQDVSLEENDGVWVLTENPNIVIASPSDEDLNQACLNGRRWTDIHRGDYMFEVQQLRHSFPELDFTPWMEAVLQRPEVDIVEDFKKANLGSRKIGRIILLNQDNEKVDALVFDEQGNAATANGNPWLSVFAGEWSAMDARPDVEDYLSWLATQRPYGPYSLENPEAVFADGHIEDVAAQLVA